MSRSTSKLEYEAPSRAVRRRAFARRVRHATITALIVFLATWYGPRAADRAVRLYWQRQCMNFEPGPRTVVYDPAHPDVPCVAEPWATLTGRGFSTLFLHRRARRDGAERLVVVELVDARVNDLTQLTAVATAYEPASLDREMSELRYPNSGNAIPVTRFGDEWDRLANYKLFAGQVDPNDSSRFTIACEGPDGSRTIEGWLASGDEVCLSFTTAAGSAEKASATLQSTARSSR